MNTQSVLRTGVLAAVVASAGWLAYRTYAARSVSQEVDRLAGVLALEPTSVVADVGAGSGAYARELATRIVPAGHVFATEIGEDAVRILADAARRAGIEHLTALQADTEATNLPQACCDAVFLRGVYHHITEPAATNASLYEALRSGGRLAIVDFEPSWFLSTFFSVEGVPANRGGHGIAPEIVVRELESAGFRLIQRVDEWTRGQYCLVFEK